MNFKSPSILISGKEGKHLLGKAFSNSLCNSFEHIQGFKGLEADVVALVDVTEINTGFSLQDAYVACSRAKHELLIIPATIEASNMFYRWL